MDPNRDRDKHMDEKKTYQVKANTLSVREVHRARLFSFTVEEARLPNGNEAEYGIIRHPGSTAIVPIAEDGTVLMMRQYRHAVAEYLLEIPAGTIENGESPLDCAMRELEEETGYTASEFTEIAQVYIVPAYSDEKIYVYLARGLKPATQHLDADEILEVVKYPFEEALRLIRENVIVDALTLLSIHQAHVYLMGSHLM